MSVQGINGTTSTQPTTDTSTVDNAHGAAAARRAQISHGSTPTGINALTGVEGKPADAPTARSATADAGLTAHDHPAGTFHLVNGSPAANSSAVNQDQQSFLKGQDTLNDVLADSSGPITSHTADPGAMQFLDIVGKASPEVKEALNKSSGDLAKFANSLVDMQKEGKLDLNNLDPATRDKLVATVTQYATAVNDGIAQVKGTGASNLDDAITNTMKAAVTGLEKELHDFASVVKGRTDAKYELNGATSDLRQLQADVEAGRKQLPVTISLPLIDKNTGTEIGRAHV